VAILTRQLVAQLKADHPDLARLNDAKALAHHLAHFRRIVVGGECYTIDSKLRALDGVYLPTSREWLFEDLDDETREALAEAIAYRPLITLKLTNGQGSRRISMASIS
jgi:hypothetical protein